MLIRTYLVIQQQKVFLEILRIKCQKRQRKCITQNKIVAGLIKDLEDAKKEQEKAEKAIKEAKEEIKDTKLSIKEKTKFIDRNKKTKNELSKKIKE